MASLSVNPGAPPPHTQLHGGMQMTVSTMARDRETRDAMTIVIAGGVVLALSFGVRSVFGGIVEPVSKDLFGGRIEVFSLAIAIQNLVWGLAQPAFGAIADRWGDRLALWLGLGCYALGLAICVAGSSPLAQHIGTGLLVGMGISGTAFGIVLTVVGRAAPAEKRSSYLGLTSALGSVGQVVLPLLVSQLIEWFDWRIVMIIVAGMLAPMALCIPHLRSAAQPAAEATAVSLSRTLRHALGQPSYLLLGLGFFVCGFHLAFITAHLPNFVEQFCVGTAMSPEELRAFGLQALAVVGLANIAGTLLASRLGTVFPKPYVLAAIYGLRSVVILAFISQPPTPLSVMIFAMAMGVLWLSTVPLTSALVLLMFGPRAMGTLFGLVFLGHQLGGFAGVWIGGTYFDSFGNYDAIWYASILLGLVSAGLHLGVRERDLRPGAAARRQS